MMRIPCASVAKKGQSGRSRNDTEDGGSVLNLPWEVIFDRPDAPAPGTIQNRLTAFEPIPCRLYLHGFYVHYCYDSPIVGPIPVGFSGQTGESFFSCICPDGQRLYDTSINGLGTNGKGIWEKIGSGTWSDTGSVMTARSTGGW
jgi:hypothetical protein